MRFKFLMASQLSVLIGKKSPKHTQCCQNMKMSNNPAKYELLIKQYLHSILDISDIQRHFVKSCKFNETEWAPFIINSEAHEV